MKFDLNSVFNQAKNVIDKANEVVSNSDTIKNVGKKLLGEKNGDKLIKGISGLKGLMDKSQQIIGKEPKEILNNVLLSGGESKATGISNEEEEFEDNEDDEDIENIEVLEIEEAEDTKVIVNDYDRVGFSAQSLQTLSTGAQVSAAFEVLYKEMNETIKFCEEQKTKREEIVQNANVKTAQVNQMTGLIKDYLEKTFDERRNLFDNYFQVLDKAMEAGNIELMSQTLGTINSLAISSPFKNLADINQVANGLSAGTEWDI